MSRAAAVNNGVHSSRLLPRILVSGAQVLVLVPSSLAMGELIALVLMVYVVVSSRSRMFHIVVRVATTAVLEDIVRAVHDMVSGNTDPSGLSSQY